MKTDLALVAKGESKTYTAEDFCSLQGKFIDPGYIHDVLLTGLQPSTVYYYSCGVPGVRTNVCIRYPRTTQGKINACATKLYVLKSHIEVFIAPWSQHLFYIF